MRFHYGPDPSRIRPGQTHRLACWDRSGGNMDYYDIAPGGSKVLADIRGPGRITHLWMTQMNAYRETVLRITWDNARHASVLVPIGDFFCLGHGIVNSHQSLYFSTSTHENNRFNCGCALNCYLPMPFRERALIEVLYEGSQEGPGRYFHIDYETGGEPMDADTGYFHAEWRRQNPFDGWLPAGTSHEGHEIYGCPNLERTAWETNYVILETEGRGQYIGCNVSITNLVGGWWGEGDEMIWVDGYHWPPDIHGTGSEDYFCQAWGMQDHAHLRCGSSVYEGNTDGYQTSYVFHVENPVRFSKEIKVTLECGHANHMPNEISSTGYWYATEPSQACALPPVAQRLPVLRQSDGTWHNPAERQITAKFEPSEAMRQAREALIERQRQADSPYLRSGWTHEAL